MVDRDLRLPLDLDLDLLLLEDLDLEDDLLIDLRPLLRTGVLLLLLLLLLLLVGPLLRPGGDLERLRDTRRL